MPLTEQQVNQIKEELDNCQNPLYFFHDDPDGLCSFLLLYKYKREGYGIVVKRATPQIDKKFLPKVMEYNPDKIFILDIAVVDQEFVDNVKVPIVWIDHHQPIKLDNIKTFNPRIKDKNDGTPVTYLCHQVVKDNLWLAAIGCIGDWFLPDFIDEFKEKYPDLLKDNTKHPGKILFTTKLGTLAKIFSFVLKGKSSNVKKCFKTLTRIGTPYEILNQETSKGQFIYKQFEKINQGYEELINTALKKVSKDPLLVYIYTEDKMSFSGDLANELLFRYPTKLIIVGREKNKEIKMSLRSSKLLLPILKKSLEDVDGYGGGHEYACGANIKKQHLQTFLDNIRKNL
jgi:single-stranded DNA-specific DHH superfamily exonuclease